MPKRIKKVVLGRLIPRQILSQVKYINSETTAANISTRKKNDEIAKRSPRVRPSQ